MGDTQYNNLPYPEATDTPYVHLDMQALAEATDDALPVACTSGTRPAHRPGRIIYETDTSRAFISTGSVWRPLSLDRYVQSGTASMAAIGANTNGRSGWINFAPSYSSTPHIFIGGSPIFGNGTIVNCYAVDISTTRFRIRYRHAGSMTGPVTVDWLAMGPLR